MTRPIVDWFSELVFNKSQIGPGRKTASFDGWVVTLTFRQGA